MILYHTSNIEIEKPDVHHSREHLDFGKGFYLTSLRNQADKYGERFLRRGDDAFVNVYELDDNLQKYKKIVFDTYNHAWLDLVTACRKGRPRDAYDIIEGGIADDQVFDTIELYFSGLYTYEQTLNQLRFKRPNHQICITNQEILDLHLHFIASIKL